jgi:RluA family pseudouridine synthase
MPLLGRLKVVFEDEALIVVDKPAGVLTVGTETEATRTVYRVLREYLNRKKPRENLFIVHRLDRDVSGLLVFAKTPEAKEHLQDQFKQHRAGRQYIAVVEGSVGPDTFVIRSRLAENAAFRVYSTRKPAAGKLAITHVRVLRRKSKTTMLQVRLETGRKHQIRVHLAERGHPIIGDMTYNSRSNPIRRLALHGGVLEFVHPKTGQAMRFESEYPKSFDAIKGS